jgi:hypothetical protein
LGFGPFEALSSVEELSSLFLLEWPLSPETVLVVARLATIYDVVKR